LPASAAIAIGLFGSLGNRVPQWSLITAISLLAAMVVIGVVYDNFPPYRVLRARAAKALGRGPFELGHDREMNEAEWLKHAIDVERRLYGRFPEKHRIVRAWARKGSTLQEYYEAERTAGYLVRIAFVLIIIDLVIGALVRH
jgi:hypothetical protein